MCYKISLKKLRELYEATKNSEYRVHKTGGSKAAQAYGDCHAKMIIEFIPLLRKALKEINVPFPFYPDGKWIWGHQYIGNYYMLGYCQAHRKENLFKHSLKSDLIMLEYYLNTIHGFLNCQGKALPFFYMDVGYSEGNNPSWTYNPKRALKFVYYRKEREWELDNLNAKQELKYYLAELSRERNKLTEYLNKNKKPSKSTIDWYNRDIKWNKKRIKKLREVIKRDYP